MMRAVILFAMLGWVGSLAWSAFKGLGIESAFPAAITSALVMGVIGLGAFSLLRTIVETAAGDTSKGDIAGGMEPESGDQLPTLSFDRGELTGSEEKSEKESTEGEISPGNGNTSGSVEVDVLAKQNSVAR